MLVVTIVDGNAAADAENERRVAEAQAAVAAEMAKQA